MFNPTEVEWGHTPEYTTTTVPGQSHPVYHWGSGGEELIKFELYFDGDRGSVGRGKENLTLQDELRWYRSLEFPAGAGLSDPTAIEAYRVILTLGELFEGKVCVVKKAGPIKIKKFTPKMGAVQMAIPMEFGVCVDRSLTANEVFAQGTVIGKLFGL